MIPTPDPRPTRSLTASLSEALTRPAAGRHLVAGGLLLALAAAAPLLSTGVLGAELPLAPVASEARAVPSPVPALLSRALPGEATLARTTPARAARGAGRSALPPTRFEVRTVPVGRTFTGLASWYGGSFQGRRTASGERFDTRDLTAASRTLPFGTRLRVCRASRCVVVRINDRGPYVSGRVLDLSAAARAGLGFSGVARVTATPVAERRVAVRPATPTRRAVTRTVSRPVPRTGVQPTVQPTLRPVAAVADQDSAVRGLDGLGLALVGASGAGLTWVRRRRS